MEERLSDLAKQIRENYTSISAKAREARSKDPSLALKIEAVRLSLSVLAVDAGLLWQRMHGADIVLLRTVGVRFVYEDSKLKTCEYFPMKSPEPEMEIGSSLDEHEATVFRSLVRLKHELGCAIRMLEIHKTDVLLMDGSLLPVPSDRPSLDSGIYQLYQEVLVLYMRLYSLSREKGCLLYGVIKDSRSRKLAKSLEAGCSDGVLCDHLLNDGERTRDFPYFDERPLKDLEELGRQIRVFYMKPSANDLPLRIEVLDPPDLEKAASVICSLCSISEHFAYPAALVEADMRAALDESHLEPIESMLVRLSGMRQLRRNSRPFR